MPLVNTSLPLVLSWYVFPSGATVGTEYAVKDDETGLLRLTTTQFSYVSFVIFDLENRLSRGKSSALKSLFFNINGVPTFIGFVKFHAHLGTGQLRTDRQCSSLA